MAVYKWTYAPDTEAINLNKLSNELTVAVGYPPDTINQSRNDFGILVTVNYPDNVSEALVLQVMGGHRPEEIYQAGAFLFGGGGSTLDGSGMAAASPSGPAFSLDTTDGEQVAAGGALKINRDALSLIDRGIALSYLSPDSDGALWRVRQVFSPYAYDTASDFEPSWQLQFYGVPTGANLITNPIFESGDFTGWTATNDANSHALWDIARQGAYSGQYCARLSFDGGAIGSNANLSSGLITITATNAYELTLRSWVSRLLTSQSVVIVQVQVKWWDDASRTTLMRQDTTSVPATPENWFLISDALDAPIGATRVEIIIANTSSTNTAAGDYFLFDDFSLKKLPASIEKNPGLGKLAMTGHGLHVDSILKLRRAIYPDGTPRADFMGIYPDREDKWRVVNNNDMQWLLHYGDEVGFSTYDNDNSEITIYGPRTIKANSLGDYGPLAFEFYTRVINNVAGARTVTYKVYLGSTNRSTGALTIGATSISNFILKGEIANRGNPAAQRIVVWAAQDGTWTPGVANATEDSTTDLEFKITATLSAATANLVHERHFGTMQGPYYHAS